MAENRWDTEQYRTRHSFVFQYGEDLVELLAPQADEAVLDLGCGTGELTNQISLSGAAVTGIDRSPEMIRTAKKRYPALSFYQQDAAELVENCKYHAVFSNAVLHWIPAAQQPAVAGRIYRALLPGGRLAVEFGGYGNCRKIVDVLGKSLSRRGYPSDSGVYFPTIGAYASLLEREGFLVRHAQLFNRPTPLEGENGMRNWLHMFQTALLDPLPPAEREAVVAEVLAALKEQGLFDSHSKRWSADYVRIRLLACKPEKE